VLFRFAHDTLGLAGSSEVGANVQRLPHLRRIAASSGRDDACSFVREQPRGLAPDPAGRAGDDADGVAQAEIHGWLA
jgi:hypothetical protein